MSRSARALPCRVVYPFEQDAVPDERLHAPPPPPRRVHCCSDSTSGEGGTVRGGSRSNAVSGSAVPEQVPQWEHPAVPCNRPPAWRLH